MRFPHLLFLMTLGLTSGVLASSDFDGLQRQSLQELPPLIIAVECSADLRENGLSCDALERSIEEKLRGASVEIQPLGLAPSPKRRPAFLTFRLSSARFTGSHTFQLYAVSLRAELVQDVLLPRDKTRLFPATTWSADHTEIIGPARIAELRGDVLSLLDEFISQYRQARMPAETK